MYKETLDVLLEGLDDPINFKKTLLENQLKSHFANKNKENEILQNDSAIVARHIVDMLSINDIIGFQTLSLKDPKIISSGIEYDVVPVTRPFQARWSTEAMEDLKNLHGIDIRCELISALANEIAYEITSEIVGRIDQVASYNGTIEMVLNPEDVLDHSDIINDIIISETKNVDANWIVVSPSIHLMLQVGKNFKNYSKVKNNLGDSGFSCVGMLDENIKVYSYLFQDEGTVLIGSKVEDREDTPIVYAPETLLMPAKSDIPAVEEGFGTMWNFETRYSLFVEFAAAEAIYRKISIKM